MYKLLNPPSTSHLQDFINNRPFSTTLIKLWEKRTYKQDEPNFLGHRFDYRVYTDRANQLSIAYTFSENKVQLEIYSSGSGLDSIGRLYPELEKIDLRRPEILMLKKLPNLSYFHKNTYVLVNDGYDTSLYYANVEHQCFSKFNPYNYTNFKSTLTSLAEAKAGNNEKLVDELLSTLANDDHLSESTSWMGHGALSNDKYAYRTIRTMNRSRCFSKMKESLALIAAEVHLPDEIRDEIYAQIDLAKDNFIKSQLLLIKNLNDQNPIFMNTLREKLRYPIQPHYTIQPVAQWFADRGENKAALTLIQMMGGFSSPSCDDKCWQLYCSILDNDPVTKKEEEKRLTGQLMDILKMGESNPEALYTIARVINELQRDLTRFTPKAEAPSQPLLFSSNTGITQRVKEAEASVEVTDKIKNVI